jgi:monoamine oxidase
MILHTRKQTKQTNQTNKSSSRNPKKTRTINTKSINTHSRKIYDLVIIGGGIAGLYTGLQTLKKYPEWNVLILEKYNLGGRIWSPLIREGGSKGIHIEAGAGRIPTSHTRIMKLIHDYQLSTFPITTDKSYRISSHLLHSSDQNENENENDNTIQILTEPSQSNSRMSPEDILSTFKTTILPSLDTETLRNHTLYELIETHLGTSTAEDFRYFFEYDSEIFIANAESGLSLIDCTLLNKDFIGIQGGLETITTKLTHDIRKLGGIVLEKINVLKILPQLETSPVPWKLCIQKNNQKKIIQSQKVVIATSLKPMKDLLQSILETSSSSSSSSELELELQEVHSPIGNVRNVMKVINILNHIHPGPLLRVYAKFHKCWFKNIGKVVCSNPIRYFIPINEKECVAMISYTDGHVAKAWNELQKNMGRKEFINTLLENLRIVFPEKKNDITEPIWIREYYWPAGCHYWGKGISHGGVDYEKYDEKEQFFQPMRGLYLCGEAISKTQAWIEGALETYEIIEPMM